MVKSPSRRRRALARPILLILALLIVGMSYQALNPTRSAAETDEATQLEAGKELFDYTCSSCHGKGAEGTSQAPSLIGVGAASVDFQMGTGRMPAARQQAQIPAAQVNYTQEQIDAVAAYIGSLGPGPEIPDAQQYDASGLSEEDIAEGGALFRANCSACHGIIGGGGAMPNGKFAPSLYETSDVHIYEAVRSGPGQMPMFSKEVVDDESLKKVIAYLNQAQDQPNHGGLGMGDAGPVSEGFWVFIVGIGGLSIVATWIAKKGARAR